MQNSSFSAAGWFFFRLALMLVLMFYINLQARSYADMRGNRDIPFFKRSRDTFIRTALLLDVLQNAKVRRGWVRFFFWENMTVLVCFGLINIVCTLEEAIRGVQSSWAYTLTVLVILPFTVAHFLIFLILDEICNKNWWDKDNGTKFNGKR